MLYKQPIFENIRTYSDDSLNKVIELYQNEKAPIYGMYGISYNEFMQLSMLDLESIATKVINMDTDEEGLVVYQEIMDTPAGNLLKEAISSNSTLKISPCLKAIDPSNNDLVQLTGILIEDIR